MGDFDNNIIEEKHEINIFVKNRKYTNIALLLGFLSLLFSFICFVEYVFNILSIVCGLGAFVFAMLGTTSDKKGRGFFGSILAIIGIAISLFLMIISIKDYQEVSRQAKSTSDKVGIYLVDKRPVDHTYEIDVELFILQGSYLYDYTEEEKAFFLSEINDKWKQGLIENELKSYLKDFILIPDEQLDEGNYYIYYNIDRADESFDKEALYYDFVFIYFDKENKFEHDLYLYTFEKYQNYTETPDDEIIVEE